MEYNILGFDFVSPPQLVTKIQISVIRLTLFQSVDLMVQYLDDEGRIIENKYLTISGEDYNQWSNDDSYIVMHVQNKLNITII
jgi:hypothetical protein